MRRDIRSGTLALILVGLGALNLGCGGGGVASNNAQNNQASQTSAGAAQPMQAPMLGFAYASGVTEVRVINGVSGASTQGSALNLPSNVTGISFSPRQNSALVAVSGGGPVGVISFQTAQPGPLMTISGAISQPDIIAFSPTGAAAALYSASEGHLQVVTGLPSSPQVTRDLTSAQFPANPQALAIADDGVTLLEGTSDNSIYLLSGNSPQLLENVSALGAIAFNPKTTDALIFDRGAGTLALMANVSVQHSTQAVASGLTGLEGAVFLASDGRNALVSAANAKSVWEVNLQSLQTQTVPLQTPATMLMPLRTAGNYLLTWQPGGLAWIIDTNLSKAAVYLVPAAATAQAELVR